MKYSKAHPTPKRSRAGIIESNSNEKTVDVEVDEERTNEQVVDHPLIELDKSGRINAIIEHA